MNNSRIEQSANIAFFISIILYVLWRVTPYSIALVSGYAGIVVSLLTTILAVVMIVKKTDGKGITVHKIVLMLPLLWFLRNVIAWVG